MMCEINFFLVGAKYSDMENHWVWFNLKQKHANTWLYIFNFCRSIHANQVHAIAKRFAVIQYGTIRFLQIYALSFKWINDLIVQNISCLPLNNIILILSYMLCSTWYVIRYTLFCNNMQISLTWTQRVPQIWVSRVWHWGSSGQIRTLSDIFYSWSRS